MKLWVDDERAAPDDSWVWSKTVRNTLDTLMLSGIGEITEMSLDYTLDDGDAYDILLWLRDHPNRWPHSVVAHSSSASGRRLIEKLARDWRNRTTNEVTP